MESNGDMYASIVDIYGSTMSIICFFNNVIPENSVSSGNVPFGVKCNLYTSYERKNANSSDIIFSTDSGTVFCIDLKQKAYSPQLEVKAVTDRANGICSVDGLVICYQGLASLEHLSSYIQQVHNIVVQDKIGMIVPLEKIDQLKEAYNAHLTQVNVN